MGSLNEKKLSEVIFNRELQINHPSYGWIEYADHGVAVFEKLKHIPENYDDGEFELEYDDSNVEFSFRYIEETAGYEDQIRKTGIMSVLHEKYAQVGSENNGFLSKLFGSKKEEPFYRMYSDRDGCQIAYFLIRRNGSKIYYVYIFINTHLFEFLASTKTRYDSDECTELNEILDHTGKPGLIQQQTIEPDSNSQTKEQKHDVIPEQIQDVKSETVLNPKSEIRPDSDLARDVISKQNKKSKPDLVITTKANKNRDKKASLSENKFSDGIDTSLNKEEHLFSKASKFEPAVFEVENIKIDKDSNDWETYTNTEGVVYLCDYLGDDDNIILPISVDGKNIDKLGEFLKCKASSIKIPGYYNTISTPGLGINNHIKNVVFGEGISEIRDNVFLRSKDLDEVYVSKSVNKIVLPYDFVLTKYCKNINGCLILGSVLIKYIGKDAIVDIPSGVTTIETDAFIELNQIKKVTVPNTVLRINKKAFNYWGTVNTTQFVLPDTLEYVGYRAFEGCEWFNKRPIIFNHTLLFMNHETAKLSIPVGVKRISCNVFSSDFNIQSVELPEGLESIDDYAFYNCTKLKNINFPSSLINIGAYAFSDCNLSAIKFGNSLTTVGEKAFFGNRHLGKVELPDSLKSIGPNAFNRKGLEPFISETDKNNYYANMELHNLALNGDLKEIRPDTIKTSNFQTIVIPEGVEKIGANSFSGNEDLEVVRLPKSLMYIDNNAFSGCISISDIKLPEKLQSIGSKAFYGCSAIHTIKFPNCIETIGDRSFENCEGLINVKIPETVKKIGTHAFYNCINLKDVDSTGNLQNFDSAFENTAYLLTRMGGEFIIAGNELRNYLGHGKKVVIPSNVNVIKEDVFSGHSEIEEVFIGDSVKHIGDRAFYNCTKLKTINMCCKVDEIGESAFSGCSSLESVDLGETELKTIQNNVFYECSKMHSVLLPYALESIKSEAFAYCNALTKVTLPETLEEIYNRAFYNDPLKNVEIPKKCKKIGLNAFVNSQSIMIYDTMPLYTIDSGQIDELNVNEDRYHIIYIVLDNEQELKEHSNFIQSFTISVRSIDNNQILYKIFFENTKRKEYADTVIKSCLTGAIDFDKYDEYFIKEPYQLGRLGMALCRLEYPLSLKPKYKKIYEEFIAQCLYIPESAKFTAEYISQGDRVDYLELLNKYKCIDSHNDQLLFDVIKDMNSFKCKKYMEKYFDSKEK